MQKNQPIHKTITVVKELPAELASRHENDERGFWMYATREIVDTAGDLVRCDGVNFDTYHNPDEGVHLKVLAQHIRCLPDGTAPVVGKVTDYVRTIANYRGKVVKAIALYCEWLRDDSGKLLPLSQHYYDMVKAGGIDSGSVGMMVDDLEPMENGGYDIKKATIFEFSLVTIPANAGATMIKEIEDKLGLKLDIEPEAASDETVKAIEPTVQSVPTVEQALKGLLDAHLKAVDERLASMAVSDLSTMLKAVSERLDVIESSLVVMSQPVIAPEPVKATPTAPAVELKAEQTINKADIERFEALLNKLNNYMDR